MIRGQKELGDRDELEELAVQVPSGDRVPARQLFDSGLVESCALVGFAGDDEPSALQRRDVVRLVQMRDWGYRFVTKIDWFNGDIDDDMPVEEMRETRSCRSASGSPSAA